MDPSRQKREVRKGCQERRQNGWGVAHSCRASPVLRGVRHAGPAHRPACRRDPQIRRRSQRRGGFMRHRQRAPDVPRRVRRRGIARRLALLRSTDVLGDGRDLRVDVARPERQRVALRLKPRLPAERLDLGGAGLPPPGARRAAPPRRIGAREAACAVRVADQLRPRLRTGLRVNRLRPPPVLRPLRGLRRRPRALGVLRMLPACRRRRPVRREHVHQRQLDALVARSSCSVARRAGRQLAAGDAQLRAVVAAASATAPGRLRPPEPPLILRGLPLKLPLYNYIWGRGRGF